MSEPIDAPHHDLIPTCHIDNEGGHFSYWMDRLTGDRVHDKAHIAALLAWQRWRNASLGREVAALRERAARAEAVLREAPHEPHCAGQLDVRVWPKETRIICCTCFKNRYQEVVCQTNPA